MLTANVFVLLLCFGFILAEDFDIQAAFKFLSRRLDDLVYDTKSLEKRVSDLESFNKRDIGYLVHTTSIPTSQPELVKEKDNTSFEQVKIQIRKAMTEEKKYMRKRLEEYNKRQFEFSNDMQKTLRVMKDELTNMIESNFAKIVEESNHTSDLLHSKSESMYETIKRLATKVKDKSDVCEARIGEVSKELSSLKYNFTTHTTDECSADPSPCHKQATCKNTDWSYACTCNAGFKGDGSDCTDVNECEADPSPCHAGATCQNNDGSYTCTCKRGYIGDGTICIDINECFADPSPCHTRAACRNNDGSYTCTCNIGYQGDGSTCTDVNECAAYPNPCQAQGTCLNNDGSYTCNCSKGYLFDGITCTDINECFADPSPCHTRATCRNNDGSYTCTCNIGYQGDGSICRDAPNDPRLQGFEVGRRVEGWYGKGTITHVDPRGTVDVSWDYGGIRTAFPVTFLTLI